MTDFQIAFTVTACTAVVVFLLTMNAYDKMNRAVLTGKLDEAERFLAETCVGTGFGAGMVWATILFAILL